MIFLRIEVASRDRISSVLTLQQNDLSQNRKGVLPTKNPVLTLQQNDLSQNPPRLSASNAQVLTLQQNDLSQNSIDIIYFMLDT